MSEREKGRERKKERGVRNIKEMNKKISILYYYRICAHIITEYAYIFLISYLLYAHAHIIIDMKL
jgi:hypothetical protein